MAANKRRIVKMSGRVTIGCVALLLTLTSVSAVQRLNSINDLKKVSFDQSVPKHSLLLLHWFANAVHIDNNDGIWLTFDPNNRDYGSHHYGNFEGLLEPLPPGRRYFTVGNLNQGNSVELPAYVVRPRREYAGRNRDRIIFSVRQQNTEWEWQRIDRVYITQHYDTVEHQGTAYDPRYTYQVTTNLLRQIREFSVGENQDNSLSELRDHFGSNADDLELHDIRNIWGELAPLGLLLFIVIKEKYFPIQRTKTPKQQQQQQQQQQQINQNKRKPQPDFVVTIPENRQNHTRPLWTLATLLQDQTTDIKLEVTTGTNGQARIVWGNVPRDRLKDRVMVVLFKNNEDQEARTYECIGDRESGSCDTSVPLNDGLQARLHKVRVWWCFWKQVGEEIWRGAEFKNPQAVLITGYNAHLQVFVKDGKACARLYVGKSFGEWKSEFSKSWIGFYTSEDKATNDYEWWQWQWATKLKPSTDYDNALYDAYEYHSGMAIAPGVQARFILWDDEVRACTPSWT